jgi:hypothetical protein
MGIPSPQERPDLYDDSDSRPGASAYPEKSGNRLDAILAEKLARRGKILPGFEALATTAE